MSHHRARKDREMRPADIAPQAHGPAETGGATEEPVLTTGIFTPVPTETAATEPSSGELTVNPQAGAMQVAPHSGVPMPAVLPPSLPALPSSLSRPPVVHTQQDAQQAVLAAQRQVALAGGSQAPGEDTPLLRGPSPRAPSGSTD